MTTAVGPLHDRLAGLGVADDMEAASAQLARAGLTDGLAVHPPTEARVAAFVAASVSGGSASAPDRPVGPIPLAMTPPSEWDLAACAVMAGCPPAAFGLVEAALAAMTAPEFNLLGIQTTTSGVAPLTVVSGETSPTPTLAVGRAVRLALAVLGNALPGITNLSTQGHPGRISWCRSETAESPWPALHLEHAPDSATGVTAVASAGHLEVILGRATCDVDLEVLAAGCRAVRATGLTGGALRRQVLVVVPPETAIRLAEAGLARSDVAQILWRASSTPPSESPAHRGSGSEVGEAEVLSTGESGGPADVLVAVCGGVGIKGTVVQTWGSGSAVTVGLVPAAG